jgi:hypothetical protein
MMAMLSYEIDDSILTFTVSGTPTLSQRQAVFDAVRADAGVPSGALVLLDVRQVDVAGNEYTPVEQLRSLVNQLGPKLGPACALLVRPEATIQARIFQDAGIGVGLQVGLFTDEPSARQWLSASR